MYLFKYFPTHEVLHLKKKTCTVCDMWLFESCPKIKVCLYSFKTAKPDAHYCIDRLVCQVFICCWWFLSHREGLIVWSLLSTTFPPLIYIRAEFCKHLLFCGNYVISSCLPKGLQSHPSLLLLNTVLLCLWTHNEPYVNRIHKRVSGLKLN